MRINMQWAGMLLSVFGEIYFYLVQAYGLTTPSSWSGYIRCTQKHSLLISSRAKRTACEYSFTCENENGHHLIGYITAAIIIY